jgi:hypothetical protein
MARKRTWPSGSDWSCARSSGETGYLVCKSVEPIQKRVRVFQECRPGGRRRQ